jgi:hypothetical protein
LGGPFGIIEAKGSGYQGLALGTSEYPKVNIKCVRKKHSKISTVAM